MSRKEEGGVRVRRTAKAKAKAGSGSGSGCDGAARVSRAVCPSGAYSDGSPSCRARGATADMGAAAAGGGQDVANWLHPQLSRRDFVVQLQAIFARAGFSILLCKGKMGLASFEISKHLRFQVQHFTLGAQLRFHKLSTQHRRRVAIYRDQYCITAYHAQAPEPKQPKKVELRNSR